MEKRGVQSARRVVMLNTPKGCETIIDPKGRDVAKHVAKRQEAQSADQQSKKQKNASSKFRKAKK